MGLHPALEIRDPTSRRLHRFIHFYNHHRAHGALGWSTPSGIIQDNLPEEHT
jgi:hypothetical protein